MLDYFFQNYLTNLVVNPQEKLPKVINTVRTSIFCLP